MKRKKPQKTTLCSMVIHDTVGGHIQVERKDLKIVITESGEARLYYASEDGDLYLVLAELAPLDMTQGLFKGITK